MDTLIRGIARVAEWIIFFVISLSLTWPLKKHAPEIFTRIMEANVSFAQRVLSSFPFEDHEQVQEFFLKDLHVESLLLVLEINATFALVLVFIARAVRGR